MEGEFTQRGRKEETPSPRELGKQEPKHQKPRSRNRRENIYSMQSEQKKLRVNTERKNGFSEKGSQWARHIKIG